LIACYLAAKHPDVDVEHIRADGTIVSARCLAASRPECRQLSLF
jgi:hypothetical protein